MAETFMQLKECNVIAFADADMLLMNRTMKSQQVADWLADDEQFFFIAKEGSGGWERGSPKDSHGRNNLANSQVSTGLMLAKRDTRTFAMLAKWWCSSEELCDTSSVMRHIEQRGCYRYDWAHEQRMIDNEFFSESADELGKALRRGMRSSNRISDYNTPLGRHTRHFWYKNSDDLAFTTAFARRIAKKAPETCAKATPPGAFYGKVLETTNPNPNPNPYPNPNPSPNPSPSPSPSPSPNHLTLALALALALTLALALALVLALTP
jgi:hypothetical protein